MSRHEHRRVRLGAPAEPAPARPGGGPAGPGAFTEPLAPDASGRPAGREDPVEAIARAVLYEGYVLWPYRRSTTKNQQRWTFGGVYPRGFCAEADQGDAWEIRCGCLVEGSPEATVTVEARFLQAVHRQVFEEGPEGLRPVDELRLPSGRHVTWDEARERRVASPAAALGELAEVPHLQAVAVAGGAEDEPILPPGETAAGLYHRSWEPLAGLLELSAEALEPELFLLEAVLKNASPWRGADRREAQRRAFLATHLVLRTDRARSEHQDGRADRTDRAAFVSLTDPPPHRADDAELCRNRGVWPVLAGEPGSADTLLASPIILEDHPRVAPESPGDLFDGGEIDQLLTLNILALTDEEKEEMAATDPRTREILERTEGLGREDFLRLHGAFRDHPSHPRSLSTPSRGAGSDD